ncbi:GntR family transcriptional regulator [Psychromarinibacter sp. C21-152]|uniref:GntR family transcriptional regulator n=1 Tax=Psychromarinibacter sediminicola TaxID=3033385 RepID=A0AAE3NWZ0_9RHOB|nr:GntR family transcriptional regulator [Psychromarinibacter sediminicola]MDF0603611.1 GntR family transcriptional regulator [Psychromarinibacter sediminicola]
MKSTTEARTAASGGGRQKDAPRKPGYSRLAQHLREEILEGRISAGTRLKVADIAERFKTSTNPAREALQILEGEGLVTITPNRGASVREISEDLVHNIFDIKVLFAGYFVRSFAESATPAEVAELRALQEDCEETVNNGDYEQYHVRNLRFHECIENHHFNKEALGIMKRYDSWLQALSKKKPLSLAQMRRSNADHWRIVEAIEGGDPDAAVRAMKEHLDNAHSVFLDRIRRQRSLVAE